MKVMLALGQRVTLGSWLFHRGDAQPETAEQLMRSRYSAWALQRIDYLIATTWPRQQRQLQRKALENWANATEWQQLKIVDTLQGNTNDTTGKVAK
jgi:SEC-C motif-containing protein